MTGADQTPTLAMEPEPPPAEPAPQDPWAALRRHTPARIALGRAGTSLPTAEVLRFAAAHAQARDAVHVPLDVLALQAGLQADGWSTLSVASDAPTREVYLRRPNLGRRLNPGSAAALRAHAEHIGRAEDSACTPRSAVDLVIVLADGLSAVAAQRHGRPVLTALCAALEAPFKLAPIVMATQARVALADEVGELLQARMALILLGERPGLSSPYSLGAYLTHAPHVGCTDAQRNCVSNIRPEGLPYEIAARRLAWLIHEATRRGLTGVELKDNSETELLPR